MKAQVLVKGSQLIGVYSNRKNIWEKIVELEGSEDSLIIKNSEKSYLNATYGSLVRFLKLWSMVRLYSKKDVNDGLELSELVPVYRVWDIVINQQVGSNRYSDDDEEQEQED